MQFKLILTIACTEVASEEILKSCVGAGAAGVCGQSFPLEGTVSAKVLR